MTTGTHPLITIGIPVFKGEREVGETLAAVQAQTWTDFEAVISVDGGDATSAAACRTYLSDPRFTLTERGCRLDWAGNINWLLAHAAGEYFCYLQHDDLIDPTYFEVLHRAITASPGSSIAYSDLRWFEGHEGVVSERPLTGTPTQRFLGHIEQFGWIPFRGLVRMEAARKIGQIRITEFRSCLEEIVWLGKLAAVGDFIRVPEVLYHKRFHENAVHGKFHALPSDQRLNIWITAFAGLFATIPLAASSAAERNAIFAALLERLIIQKEGRWMFYETSHLTSGQCRDVVKHVLDRVEREGAIKLEHVLGSEWRSLCPTLLEPPPI